jgi:hypothetical protein
MWANNGTNIWSENVKEKDNLKDLIAYLSWLINPKFYLSLLTNGREVAPSPGRCRPDREADLSHSTCAVVKNTWSFTLTSYIRLHGLMIRNSAERTAVERNIRSR